MKLTKEICLDHLSTVGKASLYDGFLNQQTKMLACFIGVSLLAVGLLVFAQPIQPKCHHKNCQCSSGIQCNCGNDCLCGHCCGGGY